MKPHLPDRAAFRAAYGLRLPPQAETESPSRNVSYPVKTFVEDHRHLLCRRDTAARVLAPVREFIDGRWLALHPTIRFDLESCDSKEFFAKQYGSTAEAAFRSRFELVLRFLADHAVELGGSGLAQGRAPMAVREEFIDYLLQYRLSEKQRRIPEAALRLYLDGINCNWVGSSAYWHD